MIRRTKNKILQTFFSRTHKLRAQDVLEARVYIKKFWQHLKRTNRKSKDTLIGLPHQYLVPSYEVDATFTFDEMYYWDSYFMVQGMLGDTKKRKLVMGILDNLLYLIKKYGMVPNANKTYLLSHSQPPLLTRFIFEVFEAYDLDRRWLEQVMVYAKQEYATVWMGTKKPHERLVHQGLSRYYDINIIHDMAEAESGWDMTTRFERHGLHYLPVDLNAFLYQYEQDFARAAAILGNTNEARRWRMAALKRKKMINKLMWNERRGSFYDYNFKKESLGSVGSLAAYTTLWTGLASKEQAKKLVANLSRFEEKGGLTATEEAILQLKKPSKVATQWAHPNGWAPLHFMTVYGLKRYGYHKEAEKIAHKWLKTNLDWFNTHGVFQEKYNVVDTEKLPVEGLYPSQTGFGWTNAVFERFCQDFIDVDNK